MSEHAAPALSVVVPSVTGWSSLAACLDSLRHQQGVERVEVVVVDRLGPEIRGLVETRFQDVRVLAAPPNTTIPALRARGIHAAGAPVVGIIEDHIMVPPTWAAQMLRAHQEGAEVVGGSIENAATMRRSDWAAFLCEYHQCLNPGPAGASTWLPGNNVTYRRSVLERFASIIEQERWEDHLHQAMRAEGVTLERRPDIAVGHKLEITASAYAGQRYLYSRAYAAMRVGMRPAWKRWMYGVAALALPPVLLARIISAVWHSDRYRPQLLRSLPLFVPFVFAWSAGEVAGAWLGAGNALERVR